MIDMQFGIHGDNIVECERMLSLIQQALHIDDRKLMGNIPAPCFLLEKNNKFYSFIFYPAFGRWEYDIQRYIREAGSVLRETPDIVLTKISNGYEIPILALEFCSALPAGNQAWQRSGRAYSLVKANIPYIFVTELGGYELDSNRTRKAARLPNPAVPFSFITYSEYTNRPIAIAYSMNPGADQATKIKLQNVMACNVLTKLIKAIIENRPIDQYIRQLKEKEANFVITASENAGSKSIKSEQWKSIYDNIDSDNIGCEIISASTFEWKKKISIKVKKTFGMALEGISTIATPIASHDLPFCIIKENNIQDLSGILENIYGSLPDYFNSILKPTNKLAICCINGFKPRGDDARPDRGLLPFLRMLIGDIINVITFVYGPATLSMISQLQNNPMALAQSNGLWEAIISLSDVIICDSMHSKTPIIQQGRMNVTRQINSIIQPMPISNPYPVTNELGENDVDTAIHLIFSNLLNGCCFEAMCNPPGGDWSGVSLMINGLEYRWLTLPRVSGSEGKRPDHIIQLNNNVIITIESKDYLSHLESNIGPRLNQYCMNLFSSPPSCLKKQNNWVINTNNIDMPKFTYVSVAAFIKRADTDAASVLDKANTDIALLFTFNSPMTELEIVFSENCNKSVRCLLETIQVPQNLNLNIIQK